MSVQEFNRFRCRQSELQTQGDFAAGSVWLWCRIFLIALTGKTHP